MADRVDITRSVRLRTHLRVRARFASDGPVGKQLGSSRRSLRLGDTIGSKPMTQDHADRDHHEGELDKFRTSRQPGGRPSRAWWCSPPIGGGKTTIARELRLGRPELRYSVPRPRAGEAGRARREAYHFSAREFERRREQVTSSSRRSMRKSCTDAPRKSSGSCAAESTCVDVESREREGPEGTRVRPPSCCS